MAIVFVLGWGADPHLVQHIRPEGCDILAIYHLHPVIPLPSRLAEDLQLYKKKYLFAWSFGVWAAERIFADSPILFDKAIALNGTPLPVSELYGIQPRRMEVTLKGVAVYGTDKFARSAYGDYNELMAASLFPRGTPSDLEELEYLYRQTKDAECSVWDWNKALVGSLDAIFPPENMIRFWGERAQVLPLPHYPFGDAEIILNEIGD